MDAAWHFQVVVSCSFQGHGWRIKDQDAQRSLLSMRCDVRRGGSGSERKFPEIQYWNDCAGGKGQAKI